MAAAVPFEVPKPWQTAMSMVSINAGLYPQQVLQHYYRQYPLQVTAHPQYTELDVWRSRRAKERGIRAIRLHHADADPTRLYLMFIFLDELDPGTKQPIVRLVTNTSIRHVLEEPCSNCPLWLPVRCETTSIPPPITSDLKNNNNNNNNHHHQTSGGGGNDAAVGEVPPPPPSPHPFLPFDISNNTRTPYQILPCCEDWALSADFNGPLSDEEKKVPQIVDCLLAEMRRQSSEIARLRKNQKAQPGEGEGEGKGMDPRFVAAGMAAQRVQAAFDATEALVQYWWAAVGFAIVLMMLLFR